MSRCVDRFTELVHEKDVVLDDDLAALRKIPDRSRIERYNRLKANEDELRWQFTKDCPEFLTDSETAHVRAEFRLARLLIAASFYDEGSVPSAMGDDFVEAELQAVVDFERYKQFDALTEDQIEEQIRRMDGEVYELVTEYTSTQIANVDELLENDTVQQDLMELLLDRYERRREKIRRGFFVYVETHGLEHMVERIEEAVQAVAEASTEREQIHDEWEAELGDLSASLDGRIRDRQRRVVSELDALESRLARGTVGPDEFREEIGDVQDRTRSLTESQDETLSRLDQQIDTTIELKGRIEAQIDDLQQVRARAAETERERARDDVVDLVESELATLREDRGDLRREIQQLEREREQVEIARERLDERRETLQSAAQSSERSVETDRPAGRDGDSAVTATIARLLEMDYLGRFDITMDETPDVEMGHSVFDVPENYWEGRSERRSSRVRMNRLLDEDETPERYPTNAASRYEVTDSRYFGLSRDTEMVIEARVHSHLEAFAANDFDARPADIDDLLSVANEAVHEAETEDFTYLLGVASPTGWTDRVVEQIQSNEYARTRFSQHVSLCLIDLQEGTVIYDDSDRVAAENASLFEPPVDAERIDDCIDTVRAEYVTSVVQDTVLLRDVVEEHGYDSHIVKRAFNRLEAQNEGEQLYVDELGLALEIA